MRKRISEATPTVAATPVDGKPGRFLIKLIDAGWGSSGYYGADVLKAAGEAAVFPAGTQMFLDHPTRTEEYDRPERTVRDLSAILKEDARYDADLKALVAEAKVFPSYRKLLEDMHEDIGVSIRAYCESEPGEAEGRNGTIITELVEAISVDYVTRAGRGGQVMAVLESARAVEEATANDTRDALDKAIVDAYGGEEQWVWVLDFDESTVWFNQSTPDSRTTYAQKYELSGTTVTLDGSPTEVRPVTTYVPVGSESGEPRKREGGTMPEISESELARLRQADQDLAAITRERDEATTRATAAESERDQARAENARTERTRVVGRIMREALEADNHKGVTLDDFQRRGILADAVVKDGVVDESATRAAFDKALDKLAEATPPARVTGMGRPATESGDGDDWIGEDVGKTLDELAEAAFDDFDGDLMVAEGGR